jgi:UDP-glucose 4-epimerase
MKIAVTGGNGRVGRAIVARALRAGHEVVSIDRALPEEPSRFGALTARVADCGDFDALRAALEGCTGLIHLAAIPTPGRHPDHVVHNNNVTGSYNALAAAVDCGIRRICQASSVNAIGLAFSRRARFDYFPLDERHATRCEDPYSLSKWLCEQQADAFARRHEDAVFASLRFHYVTPERARAEAHYLPKSDEAETHLWGYTLSETAAEACLASLTAEFFGHEVFFVTGPDTVHPRPSAELAREYFPDVPVTGDLSGRNSFFSCEKATRILGLREYGAD